MGIFFYFFQILQSYIDTCVAYFLPYISPCFCSKNSYFYWGVKPVQFSDDFISIHWRWDKHTKNRVSTRKCQNQRWNDLTRLITKIENSIRQSNLELMSLCLKLIDSHTRTIPFVPNEMYRKLPTSHSTCGARMNIKIPKCSPHPLL